MIQEVSSSFVLFICTNIPTVDALKLQTLVAC